MAPQNKEYRTFGATLTITHHKGKSMSRSIMNRYD